MKFSYRKLGDFIEEVDTKNPNGENLPLLGIEKKNFSKHRDDLQNNDLKDFKVISKNQFCYVPVTSRNGERISIALLQKIEKALVSKTYLIFQMKDNSVFLPAYLMIWFRKKEFDRYARWHSYGSARETFKWKALCDFKAVIVSLKKQNEFIERLENLDGQIRTRKKLSKRLRHLVVFYKRFFYDLKTEKILRKNIKLVRRKNEDNQITNLVGVSGNKQITKYSATIESEDFSEFKVILKNEFVWSPDIANVCVLSCWTEDSPALVSSAYQIFKIVDEKALTLGYLMSCFFDPQFDRYALYHAWGSARDKFKPPQLFNFKISLIDPKIQTLFSYLYEWFLLNQKIIDLCEKRVGLIIESFEQIWQD